MRTQSEKKLQYILESFTWDWNMAYLSFFLHAGMAWDQKRLMQVWRCRRLLSGCITKGHLPRVSRQSRLSVDKGKNEMIPVAVHKYPGICLMAEEKPGEPRLGDRLIKLVWPFIASNGDTYLQLNSIRSHSASWRELEGKKERAGYAIQVLIFIIVVSKMKDNKGINVGGRNGRE